MTLGPTRRKLSPDSQGIYDTASSKLKDAMGNISTDSSAYNQTVADAIQRRMSRYTDPAMAQARSDMQSNLADRGCQVGNEGFNTEMTRLDDSQNQSRADIADRAQITGAAQGLQEMNMQQQVAAALQSMRERQVQGVSSMAPTTQTPYQQPYDIAGSMMQNYEDQVQRSNAQNASQSNMFGSLLGAGASIFGGPAGDSCGRSPPFDDPNASPSNATR